MDLTTKLASYDTDAFDMLNLSNIHAQIFRGERLGGGGLVGQQTQLYPTQIPLPRKVFWILCMFEGFIKGEWIRHARNTTNPTILNATLIDFKAHLSKRGYSHQEFGPIIKDTINTN